MRLSTSGESEIWVEQPGILHSCAGTMPRQKHATMCGNFNGW